MRASSVSTEAAVFYYCFYYCAAVNFWRTLQQNDSGAPESCLPFREAIALLIDANQCLRARTDSTLRCSRTMRESATWWFGCSWTCELTSISVLAARELPFAFSAQHPALDVVRQRQHRRAPFCDELIEAELMFSSFLGSRISSTLGCQDRARLWLRESRS
eukprot:3657345-Rhodomonas_salina.6